MRFRPRSIVLLCALVALAIGATASAANATTRFEWSVGGITLASGESEAATLGMKEPKVMTLHYGCCGIATEATFSKVSLKSGAKIVGGKPGKFEGVLEFSGVKYSHKTCEFTKEKLVTEPLVGEIVESAAGKKGTGKIELLLSGKTKNWMVVEFATECAGAKTVEVWGSLLAEVQPQAKEVKTAKLVFSKTQSEYSAGVEYKTASGELKIMDGLIGGGPFNFNLLGEPEMELVSKELFGAF